jgi:hypothetical protein
MKTERNFQPFALVLAGVLLSWLITSCQTLTELKQKKQPEQKLSLQNSCHIPWPADAELYEDPGSGKFKFEAAKNLLEKVQNLLDSGCIKVTGTTIDSSWGDGYYYTVIEPVDVIDSRFRWYVIVQSRVSSLAYMYSGLIITENGKIVEDNRLNSQIAKVEHFNYTASEAKEREMKEKYSSLWQLKVQL